MAKGIDDDAAEKEMKHVEAIILSMTPAERADSDLLNGGRRARIAKGSGTSVEEVNRLVQQFTMTRKMMKKLTNLGPNALRGMGGLQGMLGGMKPPGR